MKAWKGGMESLTIVEREGVPEREIALQEG
jgi:hypothetical protein